MTDQPKPTSALAAVNQHLNEVSRIVAEANDRSMTQIAALVVKAGGSVRLTFAELDQLDRQTHMLDAAIDDTGITLAWLPRPQEKPRSNLVGLDGRPLNGEGS